MQEVTTGVLQAIAGELEKMLLEEIEGIAFAYKKIQDGVKISIGIDLDNTSKGLLYSCTVSYPLEPTPEAQQKQKVQKSGVINEDQGELFEAADRFVDSVARSGGGSINAGGRTVDIPGRRHDA